MNSLAAYLNRRFKVGDITQHQLRSLEWLQWGRKNRFTGLILEDEVLVLDWKHCNSYRLKVSNLANVPPPINGFGVADPPFNEDEVKAYFVENNDNPYGLWNYMRAIMSGQEVDHLTQLPPLTYRKDTANTIEQLHKLAQPTDVIFTYDRDSGLARLIRKSDRGMWSHCAMVSENLTLYEATTGGVVESPFSRLSADNLDVGLYRLRGISESGKDKVAQTMKKLVGIKKYNWYAVVRIYLHQEWGIPYRRKPNQLTPAELIYANKFQLISYA
jgi:hypothetical protein